MWETLVWTPAILPYRHCWYACFLSVLLCLQAHFDMSLYQRCMCRKETSQVCAVGQEPVQHISKVVECPLCQAAQVASSYGPPLAGGVGSIAQQCLQAMYRELGLQQGVQVPQGDAGVPLTESIPSKKSGWPQWYSSRRPAKSGRKDHCSW